MSDQAKWYSASSADDEHDDIETDLHNGWWAVVFDNGDGVWSWAVFDHWMTDEDDTPVASGHQAVKWEAMSAALYAYRELNGA